jgi:hypothetical protein
MSEVSAQCRQYVSHALDRLIETAQHYRGLIPSILERSTGQMLDQLPPAIVGQREQDRAPRGCNLLHDVELLELLYWLGQKPGGTRYAAAADRYLERFATHCTDTPSGLFPWGEHAFWDLDQDTIGNAQRHARRSTERGAYHDHLREAPFWLWEKLHAFQPRCVERFADGLKYHWKTGALAHEYWRHAYIEHPEIPLPHEKISRDFARHGGYYIMDWSFAYVHFRHDAIRENLERMTDYWWTRRHPSGLLASQSRVETDAPEQESLSVYQTLALAVSLMEAAKFLEQAGLLHDLATTMQERARVYLDGCLNAPHRPTEGRFVQSLEPVSGEPRRWFIAWGSHYGQPMSVAMPAGLMLRAYGLLNDPRCLEWAAQAAGYLVRSPWPDDQPVVARDPGQALELLTELAETTGDRQWLTEAANLAATALARYCDQPLPRGATGIDWYEAQMGAGALLLGLARCAFTESDASVA